MQIYNFTELKKKTGNQKLETLNPAELKSGVAKFSESLVLESNLYLDLDRKIFLEKKVKFLFFVFAS
jgi:hypothetical protein